MSSLLARVLEHSVIQTLVDGRSPSVDDLRLIVPRSGLFEKFLSLSSIIGGEKLTSRLRERDFLFRVFERFRIGDLLAKEGRVAGREDVVVPMDWSNLTLARRVRKVDSVSKWIGDVLVEVGEAVDDFINRFSDFHFLVTGSFFDEEEKLEIKDLWTLLYLNDDLITSIKDIINVVHNDFYELELPEAPAVDLRYNLLPKKMAGYFRLWKIQGSWRRQSKCKLIASFFMGLKKSFLPVQEFTIVKTIQKHQKALSTKRETDWEILDAFDNILERCFKPIAYSKKSEPLSTKASWENPYDKHGHYGFANYLSHKDLDFVMGASENSKSLFKDSGVSWYTEDFFRTTFNNRISGGDFVGYALDKHNLGAQPIELRVIVGPTRSEISTLVDFYQPRNIVSPAFILEPMKARTITKPGALAYHGLGKIQKSLWRGLYDHPQGFFDLIGEPLQREHILRLTQNWAVGKKFVSGDYSGATDNLHKDISQTIMQHMLQRYVANDTKAYYKAMESMINSTLDYDHMVLPKMSIDIKKLLQRVDPDFEWIVPQENGQLMGNVLSFPILCLANYLVYHYTLEQYHGRYFTLQEVKEEFPVLINGDDIAFVAYPDFYEHWMRNVRAVGFEPSLGKNHFSDKLVQLNSITYRIASYVGEWEDGFPTIAIPLHVPFVNFGLITNRKKGDTAKCQDVSRISGVLDEDDLPGAWKRLKAIHDIWADLAACFSEGKYNDRLKVLMNQNSVFYRVYFRNLIRLPWDAEPTPREVISKIFENDIDFSLGILKKFGRGFDYSRVLFSEITISQNWKRLKPLLLQKDVGIFPSLRTRPLEFHVPNFL